jgi:hypothetical protein
MSNSFFVIFSFLFLLCSASYAQETKENDLLEALSFEGFHWKGNDGFHDPSTLFERSELAAIPPWKPIPNDFPKHLLPHSPPFPTPSSTPTPSPTSQVVSSLFLLLIFLLKNEGFLGDTLDRKETGSNFETGEVPPWFNRFEFLDFRSWYFKQVLFQDIDLPSSLSTPLIRLTTPPLLPLLLLHLPSGPFAPGGNPLTPTSFTAVCYPPFLPPLPFPLQPRISYA